MVTGAGPARRAGTCVSSVFLHAFRWGPLPATSDRNPLQLTARVARGPSSKAKRSDARRRLPAPSVSSPYRSWPLRS